MEKLVNKTVNTSLIGVNGNAYALMGHFQQHAIREGWTKEEIKLVLDQATSGNYDNLVGTLLMYIRD